MIQKKFKVGNIVKIKKKKRGWHSHKFQNHVGKIIDIRDVGKLPLPSIKIRFWTYDENYKLYYLYFYPDELVHAKGKDLEKYNAKDMALRI